ncbi:MAG TPA: response regulator [Rhodopila sp.]
MDTDCTTGYKDASQWKFADPDDEQDSPLNQQRGGRVAARFEPSRDVASKGCVLVVDDDHFVRETIADLLEVVGYHPLQAADAAQAVMILREEASIDALVTDLTMPGADGIMLIRHARELRHNLPAILLTGYAEDVASVATIAGGNFHVLRKPVASERLIAQLELLVAKSPNA